MPSGAKKRKAAKKKQVHNPSSLSSSSSSSATNLIQGENDGREVGSLSSQDPSIEVEKVEDEKNSKDEGSNTKSSSSSSSDSSDDESRVVDKEVVVTESVPVVEPESLAPIVDEPVKEVEPLVEEVAHASEEKKDLVVEEIVAPVVEEETVVVSEIDSKEDCPTSSEVVEPVLKDSEAEKLPLSDEKACVEKEDVASSTPAKDSISEVNGASGANETDTVEHSDRQAPVASTSLTVQKTTSWKGCCGLFDLFSGSER